MSEEPDLWNPNRAIITVVLISAFVGLVLAIMNAPRAAGGAFFWAVICVIVLADYRSSREKQMIYSAIQEEEENE